MFEESLITCFTLIIEHHLVVFYCIILLLIYVPNGNWKLNWLIDYRMLLRMLFSQKNRWFSINVLNFVLFQWLQNSKYGYIYEFQAIIIFVFIFYFFWIWNLIRSILTNIQNIQFQINLWLDLNFDFNINRTLLLIYSWK